MYDVTKGGLPLSTDINQIVDALYNRADAGLITLLAQLVAPLTAPTAALNGSGVLTGSYAYVCTYVTGVIDSTGLLHVTGETVAGVVSAPVAASSNAISVSGIPIGGTGVVARRLYRNKSGGSVTSGPFYLVTTIADNSTTTFPDNVADTSLGAQAPYQNSTGGMIAGINALAHASALSALCHFENTVDTTRGVRGTFTRSSTANNPTTLATVANNVPCYVPGKFGTAITIWEGTTNLVYNSDFETVTTTTSVFSDPITSGTAWTVQSGSFTYSSSGATSGATGSIITAGNAAWKPLLGSDGSTSLALTAAAVFTQPATVGLQHIDIRQDANNLYRIEVAYGTTMYLTKVVGGTITNLASVAQTISASTTYTMTLALDYQGHLTAKLYAGSGTGGTLLQTLTATDTSLSGGFLLGVGGDTGVIVSNASIQAPWANGWAVGGDTRVAWGLTSTNPISGKYSVSAVGIASGVTGLIFLSSGVSNSTPYSLSGYIETVNVGASGAYIHVDFGATNQLNVHATGTTSATRYAGTVTSDSTTSYPSFRISDIGTATFDAIQLEQKSYATPYYRNDSTSALATRSAEFLSYPPTIWNKGAWAVRVSYVPGAITGNFDSLLNVAIDANDYYILETHSSGRVYLAVKSGSSAEVNTFNTSDPILQVGTRYDFCIVGDGYHMGLYINGQLSASGLVAYTEPVGAIASVNVGGSSIGAQADGSYDELAFFNRALTPAEVYSLYAATQPLIDAHSTPIAPDTTTYNSTSSSPDANDVYTVVTYTRRDGTRYMVSTLSGTVSPSGSSNYPTLTWQYYDATGTVVTRTQTFALTYDSYNHVVSQTMTN